MMRGSRNPAFCGTAAPTERGSRSLIGIKNPDWPKLVSGFWAPPLALAAFIERPQAESNRRYGRILPHFYHCRMKSRIALIVLLAALLAFLLPREPAAPADASAHAPDAVTAAPAAPRVAAASPSATLGKRVRSAPAPPPP